MPSLLTLSPWLNHQLLTDDDTAERFLAQIVEYTVAEDYAGFDLDLEGVDAADRDALSLFVARAADALHAQGKLLTLAIPAKDRDVTVGWAGPYDYAALGNAADLVTVMAYEYRGPFSGPGSVAPYDWVERVLGFATRQMPPDKVLLGVAFYGYDWNTTSGGTRSVGYPQALALAQQYGVDLGFDDDVQSATFGYEALAGEPTCRRVAAARLTNHVVTVRQPPPCDLAPPAPTPSPDPAACARAEHRPGARGVGRGCPERRGPTRPRRALRRRRHRHLAPRPRGPARLGSRRLVAEYRYTL